MLLRDNKERVFMYKVIIVDDEPIIVEGLKLGIEWANWNCEIAGTASN